MESTVDTTTMTTPSSSGHGLMMGLSPSPGYLYFSVLCGGNEMALRPQVLKEAERAVWECVGVGQRKPTDPDMCAQAKGNLILLPPSSDDQCLRGWLPKHRNSPRKLLV